VVAFTPTTLPMKRSAASPVQSEIRKEQRTQSPEMASYAEVTKSGRTPPRQRRNTESIPIPEEDHLLKTDGALRNNITVEILKKNGEDFRGQITHKDAVKLIYLKALQLPKEDLVSVVPAYRGVPSVLFKLKEVINVDKVFSGRVRFSFTKTVPVEGGVREDTYDCNIRGVREVGQPQLQRYTYLKIEGMDYQVDIEIIKKWLLQFGNIMSEITEDVEKIDISSEEEGDGEFPQDSEVSFATGIYSVKMHLHRKIPQFLPMGGKKIRIYHRGIDKLCLNCYRAGHNRLQCPNDRLDWLSYIDRGMQRANLDISYYGGWVERVADWRLKCPEEHEANVREIREEQLKRMHAGSEQGMTDGAALTDTSSQNPTTELAKTLTTTSLNENKTTEVNNSGAETSPTAPESTRPAEATLPPPETGTTGMDMGNTATPESLTEEELEELLKKKRNANAKTQGKDTLGKKSTRTRSPSLRRKTEKPKDDK
jgi:hypothetical protein